MMDQLPNFSENSTADESQSEIRLSQNLRRDSPGLFSELFCDLPFSDPEAFCSCAIGALSKSKTPADIWWLSMQHKEREPDVIITTEFSQVTADLMKSRTDFMDADNCDDNSDNDSEDEEDSDDDDEMDDGEDGHYPYSDDDDDEWEETDHGEESGDSGEESRNDVLD